MREIKFRAWDKKQKKMLKWEQIQKSFNNYWWSHKNNGNYILMQYTGINDVDGKEVYEGDIVKINAIVLREEDRWNGKTGEYMGKKHVEVPLKVVKVVEWKIDGFGLVNNNWIEWNFELIGNIYENPEFLKSSRKGT